MKAELRNQNSGGLLRDFLCASAFGGGGCTLAGCAVDSIRVRLSLTPPKWMQIFYHEKLVQNPVFLPSSLSNLVKVCTTAEAAATGLCSSVSICGQQALPVTISQSVRQG
jgi:hypothetical protein